MPDDSRKDVVMVEFEMRTLKQSLEELKGTVHEGFNTLNDRLGKMEKEQQSASVLLRLAVGDGQPGQGRLGIAEQTIDALKRNWWQFAGAIAVVLFLANLVFRK